jgi:hypothetical protein
MLSGVDSVSLAGLRAKGVTITTSEALAVAQSLFESGADDACPPFGPLSRENIVLRRDGSVTSTAFAATPTVLEAAVLVEELLPEGHALVPGALRYTLGRALHEVAAPPFDSLADFSRALRRFETGGRATIVRALYARAEEPPPVVESAWQAVGLPFAATLVAGIALICAGEAMHISRPVRVSAIAATASPAIDARPIVFNPPPMIVRVPAASIRVPAASVGATPTPLRHRAVARRDPPPPRHSGFLSRVFGRIKIRFDEL